MILIPLALFIGLRDRVGGDWYNYLPYLTRAKDIPYSDIYEWGDIGFNTLNWIFARFSWGIYGVNLFGALIFSSGLLIFCRYQPLPWLALLSSVPYLIIVVSMGYTRQGIAIGLIMPALLLLERGKLTFFILLMTLAASFHSTALFMVSFLLTSVRGKSLSARIFRLLIFILSFLCLCYVFLVSSLDSYVAGYITAEYESQGAYVRGLLNLIPSLLLLAYRRKFAFTVIQSKIWSSISVGAVLCFIVLLFFPSNSTAIDRLSLYFLPVQLVVYSYLPGTGLLNLTPLQIKVSLVSFFALVQFVWLNFATHAYGWLPYRNILFL